METSVVNPGKHHSVTYIEISADHEGRRIDNYLLGMLKNLPKTRVYQMLRRGEVRVDGHRVKQDYRLHGGEKLRLPPMFLQETDNKVVPGHKIQEQIKKSIIYKDTNIIVLNKPAGMVVHGGTGQSFGVIESVRKIFNDENNIIQLVHRLDKETSGILMLARNMRYLKFLHENTKARKIRKLYKALLCGRVSQKQVKIDLPLLKNSLSSGERLVKVSNDGKHAQTLIKLDKYVGKASLVDIELSTGRTHQIRVHTRELGHPVAGDMKYGDKVQNQKFKKHGLKRLFLHAFKIQIPGNDEFMPVSVMAPLPVVLKAVLQSLQAGAK